MKIVRVWSYSGLYYPEFGLNTDQKNSEYGHVLRSALLQTFYWRKLIISKWILMGNHSYVIFLFIDRIICCFTYFKFECTIFLFSTGKIDETSHWWTFKLMKHFAIYIELFSIILLLIWPTIIDYQALCSYQTFTVKYLKVVDLY